VILSEAKGTAQGGLNNNDLGEAHPVHNSYADGS